MTCDPVLTVLVVSDYRGGEGKGWEDMRCCLAGLADQDFDGCVEVLLVENESCLAAMPADLPGLLPGLRLVRGKADGSYELKNTAISQARSELLMVLDADNVPDRSWISAGVAAMGRHPEAVAISGRTTYAGRTRVECVLGLLSRSYTDIGREGRIELLATNNMIARRDALLATPLPEGMGPFAYRLLTETWRREGLPLFFCPEMRVVHDFEGWPMERDVRRGVGWTEIRIRQLDTRIRGALVVRRLGTLAIPPLVLYRVVDRLVRALPLLRPFGLRRGDLPLVIILTLVVHALEIPGMVRALRGLDVGPSAYR
ncbi:glycosyltransferase family 2 protein [Synechococcus sp. Cruz-9H2]|uniref:glycosyltransferase family 2 protein n=1 Tax=Synechococcus sp. Cruz-9C9 TaxID=2823731 RepID=UPI0020CD5BC1|nr:glycosyltransferase family A protein [Synechococcus sp. Cruz-9C9]MCP9818867.1 glycosyltransferase family 2 protein [Synechococcus sp. Cruz-9H2]MCP9862780.1 glycosyltransferase family 2 protein [Synechococcus sp. Cruz-7E5]